MRLLTLLLFPLAVIAQKSDSVIADRGYFIVDRFPLFHYCKNCKTRSPRPVLLSSHSYSILSVGYSFDKNSWIDLGYSKEIASGYPDKGGYLFSASLISTLENKKLINGIRISYFIDHLAGFQFYFLKFGCSAEAYTNYRNIDSVIRPEIRIGDNLFLSKLLTRAQLVYGYNFLVTDGSVIRRGKHQISINVRLLIRGWVS